MYLYELISAPRFIHPITTLDEPDSETIPKIVNFIRTNCQPWLNASNKQFIYRGVPKIPREYTSFTKKTRVSRKPKDSSLEQHKSLNFLINLAGGIANRSNSIFCTKSKATARDYGTAFVVLPIGNFNYTWSPIWKDWYIGGSTKINSVLTKEATEILNSELEKNFDFGNKGPVLKKLYNDPNSYDINKIKETIKVDEGLPEAINSFQEIMIKCKSGFYIELDFFYEKVYRNF